MLTPLPSQCSVTIHTLTHLDKWQAPASSHKRTIETQSVTCVWLSSLWSCLSVSRSSLIPPAVFPVVTSSAHSALTRLDRTTEISSLTACALFIHFPTCLCSKVGMHRLWSPGPIPRFLCFCCLFLFLLWFIPLYVPGQKEIFIIKTLLNYFKVIQPFIQPVITLSLNEHKFKHTNV